MTTPRGTARVQPVEAQLADLICSDPELLHAEFDAIISAAWDSAVPTGRPRQPSVPGSASPRPPTTAGCPQPHRRPRPLPGARGRPSAPAGQITHAYRTLIRRHHPDTRTPARHPTQPNPHQDCEHDVALRHVIAAYSVLHDPRQRADYDAHRTERARRRSCFSGLPSFGTGGSIGSM